MRRRLRRADEIIEEMETQEGKKKWRLGMK
jgi:hypothetical protein